MSCGRPLSTEDALEPILSTYDWQHSRDMPRQRLLVLLANHLEPWDAAAVEVVSARDEQLPGLQPLGRLDRGAGRSPAAQAGSNDPHGLRTRFM